MLRFLIFQSPKSPKIENFESKAEKDIENNLYTILIIWGVKIFVVFSTKKCVCVCLSLKFLNQFQSFFEKNNTHTHTHHLGLSKVVRFRFCLGTEHGHRDLDSTAIVTWQTG